MPIPAFDTILKILPPHLGDPRRFMDLSPFACSVAELCGRFATSPRRKDILQGFFNLRAELLALGIRGFQWLDGSFMEDIEAQERRDPQDMDVVTFIDSPPDPAVIQAMIAPKPELWDPLRSKAVYFVDHYLVSLGALPTRVVAQTRYWYALFSHRRDGQWKGMLEVDLQDKSADDAARMALGNNP